MDERANDSIAALDSAYHLHPASNLRAVEQDGPLVLVRGEGVRVFDEAGNGYIEGLAGLWCASLGFSEERLVQAAADQLRRLPYYHGFFNRVPDVTAKLAAKLVAITPEPLGKVFFASSGSEAVDTAIKMCWYYNNALGRPEKKKIISRRGAYHGVTIAAGSMTRLPIHQTGFDLPIDRFLEVGCPHHYRFGLPGESEEAFATRLAEELEALILHEGADTVAAFFAEPVLGAGGVMPPPRTYFEKIQPILRRHDVLFVVDEVICGFGRTGNLFGSETYDLVPDVMTMAKGLSAAYQPISAVAVTNEIHEAIAKQSDRLGAFGHGFTYGGHPVAAAVALETIAIYEERHIVDRVKRIAPQFQDRLAALADHPLAGEARGVGLIGALELVADKETKREFDPSLAVGPRIAAACRERGLLTRHKTETLLFCPPLIIKPAEIDEMFDIVEAAIDEVGATLD